MDVPKDEPAKINLQSRNFSNCLGDLPQEVAVKNTFLAVQSQTYEDLRRIRSEGCDPVVEFSAPLVKLISDVTCDEFELPWMPAYLPTPADYVEPHVSSASSTSGRVDCTSASEDVHETFKVTWEIRDAERRFNSRDKTLVSPWLDTCFGSATLKMTITACGSPERHGATSFQDSQGRGGLQVKLTEKSDAATFRVWIGSGNTELDSPGGWWFTHDFGRNGTCCLPAELGEWDFAELARKGPPLRVCLEIKVS